MKDICEWGFPEPSHLVDIERVCLEIGSVPAIVALAYMENLKTKAPIVFERLRKFTKENNLMNWYNWGEGGVMTDFASYERFVEATVTTVKHTVRIQLNSDRLTIETILKNVPYEAKVSMVVDDSELSGYGEIVFTEEF